MNTYSDLPGAEYIFSHFCTFLLTIITLIANLNCNAGLQFDDRWYDPQRAGNRRKTALNSRELEQKEEVK
jgi:hypothetical protein